MDLSAQVLRLVGRKLSIFIHDPICMYVCIHLKYILIIDISMPPLAHEMGLVSHSQTYAIWTCEQDIGQFQQEKIPLEVCLAHNTTATHKLKLQITITSCENSKTQIMSQLTS